MKIKFNFFKLILILFCVLVVFTTLYHLYNYLYKAPQTEFAVQIDCEDKVSVKGYFVRNEKIINASDSRYYDIILENGGKVGKDGTIANVYSTDNAAHIQSEIRNLQKKIDEFDSIISTASKYREDLSYSSEIKKNALEIAESVSGKNVNSAFAAASELNTSIIKSKIASGEITDYSEKLKELERQRDELKSQSSAVVKYVTSPVSGYFSYRADGLEEKLNIDMTNDITPELFEQIEQVCTSENTSLNSIGKVVEGSDWRVCFKAKASKFDNVKAGKTLYIRLPSVTEDKIKCTVVDICKKDEEVYVVLESNMITGELISQRVCDLDVIIDSFSGIRIDKNAIRKIDGEDGVFVMSNGIVRFRKVNILYFSTSYVVIEYVPANASGVQVFDEVVVRGSDLYDRKVIG